MDKIKFYFFSSLLVFAIGLTLTPRTMQAAKPASLDTVVAVVGDDVITQSELDKEVEYIKIQLKRNNTPLPTNAELDSQVLERMIDQKLELQMAAKMNISIDDAALDQTIANITAKNQMNIDALKQTLRNDNINYDFYRNQVREQLIIQQLLQREVAPRVYISKQDVDNILNSKGYQQAHEAQAVEYNIEDILIALPDEPSSEELAAANKKAADIIRQLKAGANFNQLAAAQSNGDEALQGGALGWRTPEQLPQVFVQAVQGLNQGDVSAPLRTGNGIHVLRLVGVKSNDQKHIVQETHVRHILIKTDAVHTDETVRKELLDLKKQIASGVSFEQIAEKYSQDPTSAIKGGDLGWVQPGALVPPFEKAMDALAINQISAPVKSQYGWHLIQVLARREKDNTQEYKELQVRRMLFESRMNEKTQDWLQRMRQTTYIKIYLKKEGTPTQKKP
ncbi:MAG: molecular chaperone SurA [Gammaproteobacteria bacterium]|jgi:peptidyl-prolyl cis-trans isomerase SurA|nr:molecular chaperone SurA [Gammaproteobacteria bacterium]